MKDQGGLLYLSENVLKILKTCKTVFKTVVSGKDFQNSRLMLKSKLKLKLRIMTLRSMNQRSFYDMTCYFNNEMVTADCHSYQLTNEILTKFMKMRLLNILKIFYRNGYEKRKFGIRQKLNKSVIFQGL